MATKQQAILALAAKHPAATLTDESNGRYYSVQLEAPRLHHWGGSVHCQPVVWHDGGNKPEFWGEVIKEIDLLQPPELCTEEPCEGVLAWGECEYWVD